MSEKLKAISLFSGAGIGELKLPKDKIEVIAANELIPKRAQCYSHFYPETEMICGDITDKVVKNKIIEIANKKQADLLLVTPPCQGVSTLGKNKKQFQFENDNRNFLILEALDIIDSCNFDYILIENVPRFIKMYFPFEHDYFTLEQILNQKFRTKYNIEVKVLNAKDYGVPQLRPRAIIKLWKKGKYWAWPKKDDEITLEEAIGFLPSLEPGEDSGIKWHYAKPENPRAVLAMRHTKSGQSAIKNKVFYPKKEDGTRIKGFHNTFKRLEWDKPCPARTTYCGSISSHNNVHPGHLLSDGTYSDPRVLTLLETFIVSSIPEDIDFPDGVTDSFIRTIIGEAIPPQLMKRIIELIGVNDIDTISKTR